MKTEDTLFGRLLELSEEIPEDVIRMNPKTWGRIAPIARRGSIPVKTENKHSFVSDLCPQCSETGKWDTLERHCYTCGYDNPIESRWRQFWRQLLR